MASVQRTWRRANVTNSMLSKQSLFDLLFPMQKTIIASSLAVLASGASLSDVLRQARLHARAEVKAKSVDKEGAALSVASVLKNEALVIASHEDDDDKRRGRFFEISMGPDCDKNVGRVHGMEMGRCINGIENYYGSSHGMAVSEVFYEPNNGGFPIVVYFDGHGCNMENAVFSHRINKVEFGFPATYHPTDGCVPFFMDGNPPAMIYGGARWEGIRFNPDFDSTMTGYDSKHKACMKNKYVEYEVTRADMCVNDGDEDATSQEWARYDVANCNTGSAMKHYYSAAGCMTSDFLRSKTLHEEECLFDADYFLHGVNHSMGFANFEYESKSCKKVTGVN